MADPVRIVGARELARALRDAGDGLQPKLKEAGKAAAEPVAFLARQLAPYGRAGDRRRGHPGALGRSVRTGATTRSATVKAGGRAVPYAPVIHFGGRKHGRKAWRGPIRGQPFLYDALERRQDEVVAAYVDAVHQVLVDADLGG